MKLNRLLYLFKEGIKSIFTHGFMSFASITIIAACLIIMGNFSLLALNLDATIEDFEQDNEILAFVDDAPYDDSERGAAEYLAAALELQDRIESVPNVREVRFVSRDEAMENFVADYDDKTMFSDVDSSVLRHRYVIYLNDLTMMETTAREIGEIRGIGEGNVQAHLEISRGFITVRNVISVVSLVLIVILFIISLFIMANTIKLATFGRKEEIAIMKMVGAGNFFIRFPFLVEGLILGLIGAAAAFFIQWGIYDFLREKLFTGFIATFITVIPFDTIKLPLLAVFVAIGLIVGAFGSNIAIRNYLKV